MHSATSYPLLIAGFFLTSHSIPDQATAIKNFDQKRYLGKWYEMARLDYYWERGMDNVTATYSLKDNGDIRVDNRGRDIKHDKWKESVGKAKPVGDPTEAKLKVSFFGPFYAGYNVIALDKDYQYALVIGENTDYMWILSRTKTIPEEIKKDYVAKAKALGYPVEKLIWCRHDRD